MFTPNSYIILENAGDRPTIPLLSTLTPYDVDWRDTDIGIGEYAYNLADGVWIYRDSNGMHEYEDPRFKNLMTAIEQINTTPVETDFSQMFELKELEGVMYIQAKLDFVGARGIQAYSSTEVSIPAIWEEMPYATDTTVGGIKVGPSLSITNGVLDINGDIFNLTNYYTKTDSDNRYGRLAFTNTWAENQTMAKNLTVTGNLYVNGTEFIANTQTVQIEDNLAIINFGEVGAGITAGFAGWQIDRGSLDDFLFGFTESVGYFQVGKSGAMQTVATREDSPTPNYYAKWNNTLKRFDTAIPAFSEIGSKPTTLSGYGITDAVTLNSAQTISAVKTFSANPVLSAASATLSFSSTSGTKTINTGGTTNLLLSPGGNVGIGSATTSKFTVDAGVSGSSDVQQWLYNSNSNYRLDLSTQVSTGLVKWGFSMVNNGTLYSNVLVFDKGNIAIGQAAVATDFRLDVNGNVKVDGNIVVTGEVTAYAT